MPPTELLFHAYVVQREDGKAFRDPFTWVEPWLALLLSREEAVSFAGMAGTLKGMRTPRAVPLEEALIAYVHKVPAFCSRCDGYYFGPHRLGCHAPEAGAWRVAWVRKHGRFGDDPRETGMSNEEFDATGDARSRVMRHLGLEAYVETPAERLDALVRVEADRMMRQGDLASRLDALGPWRQGDVTDAQRAVMRAFVVGSNVSQHPEQRDTGALPAPSTHADRTKRAAEALRQLARTLRRGSTSDPAHDLVEFKVDREEVMAAMFAAGPAPNARLSVFGFVLQNRVTAEDAAALEELAAAYEAWSTS